jgi:tetratricopeptide (TPR) repeat protein
MPIPPSPTLATVKDVAESIIMAQQPAGLGRTIFFIGAGCSVSARVPAVPAIAQRMVQEIAGKFRTCPDGSDPATCYFSLLTKERISPCFNDPQPAGASTTHPATAINWHSVYDQCFDKHFRSPDDVRDLFGRILADCGDAINWAHLCLGELCAQSYVSTVLTTNFDQLVLTGMANAGLLPVVCDGLESLNRLSSSPSHPQLVELHGSRHTYRLRNRPSEVASVAEQPGAISSVLGLFNTARTFVAVGYGGREDGVMDLLIEAARTYPDKNMFWVEYSEDITRVGPKVREFLSYSSNSSVVAGQDADKFFLELCREMGVGPPGAVREPLARYRSVLNNLKRSDIALQDIMAEMDRSSNLLVTLEDCERQANEGVTSTNVADEVRQLRLRGEFEKAYEQALNAVLGIEPQQVPVAILKELIAAGGEYANEQMTTNIEKAIEVYSDTSAKCELLLKTEPGPANATIFASTLRNLGQALLQAGDFNKARESYERALALDGKTAEAVGNDQGAEALADSHQALSDVLIRTGDLAGAVAHIEEALKIRDSLVKANADDRVLLHNLSMTYDRLGDARSEQGDFTGAKDAYERALTVDNQLSEKYSALPDQRRNLAVGNAKLGDLLRAEGHLEEARDKYSIALRVTEELLQEFPKTGEYKRDLSIAYAKMGDIEKDSLKFKEADLFYQRALSLAREMAASNPRSAQAVRDVSMVLTRLGTLNTVEGNLDTARRYAEEALEIDEELCRKNQGFTHNIRDLALSCMDLGRINERLGNLDGGLRYYKRALELCEQHVSVNPASAEAQRDLSVALESAADIYEKRTAIPESLEYYKRSLIIARSLAAAHPENPQFGRDLEITENAIARLEKMLT